MEELCDTEAENRFQEKVRAQLHADLDSDDDQKQRRKPGPQKKENPRSEKINCRLTKEEKAAGLRYCKKHGTTEAKLLRASYLAAITQTPGERIDRLLETFMPSLDEANLRPDQKLAIRSRTKEVLKRSATVLLLILLGAATVPIVVKAVWNGMYEPGKSFSFREDETCIMSPGQVGCTLWAPAPPFSRNPSK